MKMRMTDVIDSGVIKDTDESKILMMNELIETFAPVLHEELRKKHEQFLSNKSQSKDLKNTVLEFKTVFPKIKAELDKEVEKKNILESISALLNKNALTEEAKVLARSVIESIDKKTLADLKQQRLLLQQIVETKKPKKGKPA